MKRGLKISKTLYLYSSIASCHVHFYYIGNVCIESLYSDVRKMKVCISCRNGLSPPHPHSPRELLSVGKVTSSLSSVPATLAKGCPQHFRQFPLLWGRPALG